MINEAADSYRRWHLEEDFVVVYWDQRACGKSFSRAISPQSMTIDRLIADTHELIETLAQRFDAPAIYLVGFSFGGTIAALTAGRHPERIRAMATVGMDVQFDHAERVAYAFVLDQATQRRHKRALRALRRIGPPPHLESSSFNTRVRWLTTFGGANRQETFTSLLLKTLRQLIVSRDYAPGEIIGTLRGMRFTLDHLLPQMAGLDLSVLC
jgi:pimeloyl-ACP methyl ester carboxylesterase